MTNTTAAAAAAADPRQRAGQQIHVWSTPAIAWLQTHWLQILIALGAGVALIVLALHCAARARRKRLCAARRVAHRLGRGVRPRDRARPTTSSSSCSRRAARRRLRAMRARRRRRRRRLPVHRSPRCSRRRSGRARSSSARSSTAPSASDYHGEALVSAMGLIRLLVTFVAVRDRADRRARQSRRQRHRPGRGPGRRRHRDRPGRAGHLRRSVRRARDHLRPAVPRGDAITFDKPPARSRRSA